MIFNNFEEAEAALEKYPFFAYAALRAAEMAPNQATRQRMEAFADANRASAPTIAREAEAQRHTGAPATPASPGTDATIETFLQHFDPAGGEAPLPYIPASQSDADPVAPPPPAKPEKPALTESFARILIKNRNYSKALAIIEELNLKNPEKSIYFADQIRFLKKLIINQAKTRARQQP